MTPLVDAASWRIAAELCRRSPALRIRHTHPGGGQYDCLTIIQPDGRIVAHLNREGRMCVELRLDGKSINRPVSEVWERLIVEDLPTVVDEVSSKIGLNIPTKLPKSNTSTLCYRLIAAVLGINSLGRVPWTCESAAFDSSGGAGSLVLSYGEDFPGLSAFLREVPSESRFQRAASCWILKKGQQQLLCLREDGQGERTGGGSFDFAARYKSERRLFMIAQELLGKEFDL